MKDDNVRSGGVGFCGLLTVALIVLRLTGFIDWDWWWVLAPLWVPTLVGVVALAVLAALSKLGE